MAVECSTYVWMNSKQSGSKLLILLALADWSNLEGNSWPSLSKLAEKARMSVRNAQFILKTLIQDGELAVEPNADHQNGRGITNRYRLVGFIDWYERVKTTSPLKEERVKSSVKKGEIPGNERVKSSAYNTSLDTLEDTPVKEKDSAGSIEPAQAAESKPEVAENSEKPTRKQRPWYDFILAKWGIHEGMNGDLENMLRGVSKKKGYKEYNFDPPATLDELREWHEWYFWYDRQPDGGYKKRPIIKALSIVAKRGAIQSSVYEFRLWKAAHSTPNGDTEHPAPKSIYTNEEIAARARQMIEQQKLRKAG